MHSRKCELHGASGSAIPTSGLLYYRLGDVFQCVRNAAGIGPACLSHVARVPILAFAKMILFPSNTPTLHISTIPTFANCRVLVIGDAILDRYWFGEAGRLSREAPVPVVVKDREIVRCGGAANAAANIVSLGAKVTLLACCGSDREGGELAESCEKAGISPVLIDSAPVTAVKLRILAQSQQMLRVDNKANFAHLAKEVAVKAGCLASEHDVILMSDYGLGTLGESADIIAASPCKTIVDPRGGDWDRYRGAALLTPNLEEFATASVGRDANQLMSEHSIHSLLITKGKDGMQLHLPNDEVHNLPTHAVDVYDVTGAGDTVCATMALGMASGMKLVDCMRWANAAASAAVGKLGAAAVAAYELSAPPSGRAGRVMEQEDAIKHIMALKAEGKKIVMTNGCFDILHAGHLTSLTAASQLGDILLVAVNDDASVTALKGSGRPVNALANRMELLAGIGCVDVVVPFTGTNAANMLEAVKPDVYTKGADWQVKTLPEAVVAEKLGVEIVLLDLVKGLSTSGIANKLKKTE